MKKLVLLMAIITTLAAGFANAYQGKDTECRFCKTKYAQLDFLKKELNLSNEQVDKLKQIKEKERQSIQEFMKQHKMPLVEATKDGEFNKDIFIKTAKENMEKMSEIKAEYFKNVFEILDKGQREKFIDLMKKRMERMHQRMRDEM